MVAAIQLAIMVGSSLGGLLFDCSGYQSTFVVSAALLGGAALLAIRASRDACVGDASEAPLLTSDERPVHVRRVAPGGAGR
jgi:hypothetical protein